MVVTPVSWLYTKPSDSLLYRNRISMLIERSCPEQGLGGEGKKGRWLCFLEKGGSRPSMASQRRVLCFGKQEAFQRSSLRCPWFQCAERSFETEHETNFDKLSRVNEIEKKAPALR